MTNGTGDATASLKPLSMYGCAHVLLEMCCYENGSLTEELLLNCLSPNHKIEAFAMC